jgi:hypothetical protein
MTIIKKALLGIALSGVLTGNAFAQENLTAETAAPVAVPGNTVLGLAEAAAAAGVADIQVAAGQTLTNSVQNVAEGNTDIAAAPFLLPFLLSKGAGPYAKLGPETGAELANNLAVLYTYRFGVSALSAYNSRNFGGWDAIAGATIYNGPPRGVALTRARGVAKIVTGLDDGDGYTGLQVNWGQAVKTMTDGSADAHILPTNFPDGRLAQAAASGAMTVFSMPIAAFESDAAQNFIRAPGSVGVVVPKDGLFGENITVASEDDMFRGIGEVGGDVVNKSMDDDTAYALTKAFLDSLDTIRARTPFMPNVWLGETDPQYTGLCSAVPLTYHPGAVRAWEEAGYTIPDCAKP